MALFNATNFNAEVFGKYVDRIPNLKRNELIRSKAIVERQRIASIFSEQAGGNYAATPLFGQIGGTPANYDGNTDTPTNTTKTFSHYRVVVGRQNSWTENDFSADIAGGADFMDNVGQQIAEYWDAVDQDTILSILKGIFSMTGTENKKFVDNHTYDVTAVGDGLFGASTLNKVIQQAAGDNKQKFSLVIMHSEVATNLENLNLMEYLKYTDANGIQRDLSLASLNGKLVLIDDSMPVEHVAATGSGDNAVPAYNKYTTYVLGDGAIEYTNCGVEVPYEMDRDPKTNGGQTTLYSRQRKIFAPYGINFTKKSMVSLSPTDAELQNGTNWELVNTNETTGKEYINHKAIPIARVISKG